MQFDHFDRCRLSRTRNWLAYWHNVHTHIWENIRQHTHTQKKENDTFKQYNIDNFGSEHCICNQERYTVFYLVDIDDKHGPKDAEWHRMWVKKNYDNNNNQLLCCWSYDVNKFNVSLWNFHTLLYICCIIWMHSATFPPNWQTATRERNHQRLAKQQKFQSQKRTETPAMIRFSKFTKPYCHMLSWNTVDVWFFSLLLLLL